MSVVVTGSRNWPGEAEGKVHRTLDVVLRWSPEPLLLLHGGAAGADSYAEHWYHTQAGAKVVRVKFPAKWSDYARTRNGKNPAGAVRNREMLTYAQSQLVVNLYGNPIVVAFPLPESKGTFDCMKAAVERSIVVFDMTDTLLSELETYFRDAQKSS